ncbi:hypothetical protein QJS10_CPA03g02292 [Acorus calamus]|uniref:RING-type domain-containing protein n=1 Tax=Acorus calamus TaxID=4465 RepID=A0AAV9FB95_ACOCL|nr:hypothetical protein QJS10_CPA03g02292 [Acorus calamus]
MAVQAHPYTGALSLPLSSMQECMDFEGFLSGGYGSIQQQQCFSSSSSNLDAFCSPLFEKQRQEIDRLLYTHNEKLRLLLQQLRNQHVSTVLKWMDSKASHIVRKKEKDIADANFKTVELEIELRRLEQEIQMWQRKVREAEDNVLALNGAIEQVREGNRFSSVADDASSCCCCSSSSNLPSEVVVIPCKVCCSRDSCMLMLPCRHLCACKSCDGVIQSCPICNSVKRGSIEVFFQ